MTVSEHLTEWHGLPVFDFPDAKSTTELPAAAEVAWRIAVEPYDDDPEKWPAAFARFLAAVDTTEVTALIVGQWGEAYDVGVDIVVEALTAARDRFPALRALFIGDITFEQAEITWIEQGDITPLLDTFPDLLAFGVRGGQNLAFPAVAHQSLRTLIVEAGGLGADVVRGIGASEFPELEHLDIWLGTSWYGADATVDDLEPFLTGTRLPKLQHLGLRNSDIQDDVAAALAGAPVVARLHTLDLSMGTLGNEGVEALLGGQPLTHLRKLDLHHHFVGEPLADRLLAELTADGVEVDLSGREAADRGREDRYTAVSE
ncbi:STM4015 family protein [Nocardia asteroides]|uniref:STM4015 family protein n=1 Tax=Nocardia asteroides TaxID=1824 RepID=UPI001E35CCDF|nr:STM4015 family protein [Nocardia asteroides]UGT62735.1 STM4015 family protein [Nocardia asteroides]